MRKKDNSFSGWGSALIHKNTSSESDAPRPQKVLALSFYINKLNIAWIDFPAPFLLLFYSFSLILITFHSRFDTLSQLWSNITESSTANATFVHSSCLSSWIAFKVCLSLNSCFSFFFCFKWIVLKKYIFYISIYSFFFHFTFLHQQFPLLTV